MSRQQRYVDEYHDASGSDIDEPIMTTVSAAKDEENIGDEQEDITSDPSARHVNSSVFSSPQTTFIDISVTISPEEAQNNPSRLIWSIPPEATRHLKQNMAETNRHIASDSSLVGDVNKVVPLGFRIVSVYNGFPFQVDLVSSHMLPSTVHAKGASLWTVSPNTSLTTVNEAVFRPRDVIDRKLYENAAASCTLAQLDADITIVPDTRNKKGYGQIAVGTLAHDELMIQMNRNKFSNDVDLSNEMVDDILHPPAHVRSVTVTKNMANVVKETLAKPLRDIASRFMNLDDFQVTFVRSDGRAWNSHEGLDGVHIGSELDHISSQVMMTNKTISVKGELTYVTFE